jgi:hypothetical protein
LQIAGFVADDGHAVSSREFQQLVGCDAQGQGRCPPSQLLTAHCVEHEKYARPFGCVGVGESGRDGDGDFY